MTKPDDSSLDPDQRRAVEERARQLLDRADAWGRFPTPVDDLLSAANLKVAPSSIFDPAAILAYIRGRAADAAISIKSAMSKIFGLYDGHENLIHIDGTVAKSKQTFLKLHEAGHHEMPSHRKMFRLFQECEKTLAPDIADLFEREANNFARFALFQGDAYARKAADYDMGIKAPMALAKEFGASQYASAREFARSNHRACAVYILNPAKYVDGDGYHATVRRIEVSSSFMDQFGRPADTVITPDHVLGSVLPIGRKMTRPTGISIVDRAGTTHDCVAEAFDTQHNILVLVYPVKVLTAKMIIMAAEVDAF
ncbi:ImmA/IrrE family metallo-endopeptidase [Methylocella silvestris]|uniref:IrrE N-terminal-like domain-containing protein n=1 Tax=Methylocella silvestris TaxID=199596 RepID=A0A2J7TCB1_METSI|nr:hypothetical protein [Methylocella silvestris]PNG24404.1 hypothetical protein CR492_18785 [Methylocella silvestris]